MAGFSHDTLSKMRGSLPPSTWQFARATTLHAAGHPAAAEEIIHIRESALEVRSSRRRLTSPVIIVSGARGADVTWRGLPAKLSLHGAAVAL